MNSKIAKLGELYANKSRHSQYQVLASNIEHLIDYKKPEKSKYEKERLEYIKKNVELKNKTILEIGGNTGYFTFESCKENPKSIDFFEGNIKHAEFVQLAAEIIGLADLINVHPEYFLFRQQTQVWDVVYFLNVIHHIGFDFEKNVTGAAVQEAMLQHINSMAEYSRIMVFQMGFNWYGNINSCLFKHGTKEEMEEYLRKGTEKCWEIEHIGIPVRENDQITYEDCTQENNIRIDEYGEFLNRPLFIMKSKLV